MNKEALTAVVDPVSNVAPDSAVKFGMISAPQQATQKNHINNLRQTSGAPQLRFFHAGEHDGRRRQQRDCAGEATENPTRTRCVHYSSVMSLSVKGD